MNFVCSGGVRLYYERWGSGPAVVFCHGAGSNAATWWQQIPSFARHFTCIIFDSRCFGRSAADLDAFIPDMFSRDLLAILDAEEIDQAALVCQSMGGMTGLRFALEQPARVSAFVPCDTPLAINHATVLSNVKNYLASAGASTLEERAMSPRFVHEHPELAFLYRQINLFNSFANGALQQSRWAEKLALLFSPEYLLEPECLQELACPTLFVVGSEDPLLSVDTVREMAAYARCSQVVEINDAGHSPYFEQPVVFNEVVGGFLRQHLLDLDAVTLGKLCTS